MARYVAKPVEVDAVRWDGAQFLDRPEWLRAALAKDVWEPGCVFSINDTAFVQQQGAVTAHALKAVAPGDWIVRQGEGGLIHVADATFRARYVPVPEAAAA